MTDPLIFVLATASIAALVFVTILSAGMGSTFSGFFLQMAIFRSLFGGQSQQTSESRGTVQSVLILTAIASVIYSVASVFSTGVAFIGLVAVIGVVEARKRL